MGELRGLISIDELEALVASEDVDTVVTAFTDHYGRVHGKRFTAQPLPR